MLPSYYFAFSIAAFTNYIAQSNISTAELLFYIYRFRLDWNAKYYARWEINRSVVILWDVQLDE